MAKMQNGNLLKEIYDKVSDTQKDVAVLLTRSDIQDEVIKRHESELEWLKKKVLPFMGGAIVIAYLLRMLV
jgi:hypothetical protein